MQNTFDSESFVKRTWASVNLDHIAHNLRVIRASLGGKTPVMGIVKADAYGHGDYHIAKTLLENGVDFLGVSNIDEALSLRRHFHETEILILGYTPPAYAPILAENRLTQTIFSPDYAQELSVCALSSGCTVRVHIKIDTGMSRIGFLCGGQGVEGCVRQAARCYDLKGICICGIYTHFSCSDECAEDSAAFTRMQYQLFCQILDALKALSLPTGLRHCCNSGAVLNYPEMALDIVRPGLLLYGLHPSDEGRTLGLRPAMELKSVVTLVKEIGPGQSVSYGRAYTTTHPTKIASVAIGYADGYPRRAQGASVLVRGRKAPVVGRICMDQLMVDCTHIPDVRQGDEVTIFGHSGDAVLSTEEFASCCGTVNYEVICSVGTRVPRIYTKNGEIIGTLEYLSIK